MTIQPLDQEKRLRFARELDRNFSVIAAAGAGKTTAITDRIVQIAQDRAHARQRLPRLVVVTFTNRAADEMQQRARQRIFEAGVSQDVLAAFNRAFFGTIHSFCAKLLATHGHYLGLASRLELITDDEDLWNDFVQRTDVVGQSLSPENRRALLRHVQLRDLMTLGRRGNLPLNLEEPAGSCPPPLVLSRLIQYQARGGATRIEALKIALREWQERLDSAAEFVPLLECNTTGKFREEWEKAFREFHQWLSCCSLKIAAEVQREYRQFRAEHGMVTFDDQIALALRLTEHPEAIARIRARDYIVILDEAQDTDPYQFAILTEIARPKDAPGRWIDQGGEGPRPGRFCMVGDFQQSIYGERADLGNYERVHQALTAQPSGEELKFAVTFRLGQEQIDFVNESFRDILHQEHGQVQLIELLPRPNRTPGQVVRLDIASDILQENPKASEFEKTRAEAMQLANWLAKTQCERLRARSWEEVAILCPRKRWFRPIAEALRRAGIDSQIQSETDVKGDSPAHAWFTALLTIMTQPRCGFEIVGVLREIFGVSDHALAEFANGRSDRFHIETESEGGGIVETHLNLLSQLHRSVADQPLFTAVERIVETTGLRDRLRALPPEEYVGLEHELDVLLQSAAAAEANGATLEEFADLLRANFTSERESSQPRAGAIQLITCQKAKGLEWDAIIVPFLARRVHTADESFPRILPAAHLDRALVVFSKATMPSDAKEVLKTAHRHEMERLLYVAFTRARHTLVLAQDRELFAKSGGVMNDASLLKWLKADAGSPNESRIARLRGEASADIDITPPMISRAVRPGRIKLPGVNIDEARRTADAFPRRLLPSGFARDDSVAPTAADERKETEWEFRPATLPSAATRYGTWWHGLMQELAWSDAATWDDVFAATSRNAPDPARSEREWNSFRRQINTISDLPFAPRTVAVAQTEIPLFWPVNDSTCVEGVLDLAVFGGNNDGVLIIDWKTNNIRPEQMEKLRVHYRPQMAAYAAAVARMTGRNVRAAIYSTALGEFVSYDQDELDREWNAGPLTSSRVRRE